MNVVENHSNRELWFDDDFSSARDNAGRHIVFTRSEARALSVMAQRPGQVFSRNQLLDAISATGSDKNDRNIDFLINRIRRKLGDSARDPAYIATRYGEGYVWLAKLETAPSKALDAHVVIGPLKGLELLNGSRATGRQFADQFAQQLRSHLKADQDVVIIPDYVPDRSGRSDKPELEVGLTFFYDRGETECVITARSTRENRICYVKRIPITDGKGTGQALDVASDRIGELLLAKFWEARASKSVSDIPLPVAMHEAADQDTRGDLSWPENDKRLRTLRAEHPDDPAIKLMYATHLHTKYITRGREIFQNGEEDCARDEAEIERLVLDSLDYAQSVPEHATMAAKLLYFVDQGYGDTSLELARNAHQSTTSIASSLAIYGQLLGFLGETDDAVEQLQQALQLTEEDSHFYRYVLIMLCQALMAANRRDELAEARNKIYRSSAMGVFLEPLFADPISPSLKARGVVMMLSRKKAVAILKHLHYVSARLYRIQEHRENSLRTPVNLFVRRFGRNVVPQYILDDVPGLFS